MESSGLCMQVNIFQDFFLFSVRIYTANGSYICVLTFAAIRFHKFFLYAANYTYVCPYEQRWSNKIYFFTLLTYYLHGCVTLPNIIPKLTNIVENMVKQSNFIIRAILHFLSKQDYGKFPKISSLQVYVTEQRYPDSRCHFEIARANVSHCLYITVLLIVSCK